MPLSFVLLTCALVLSGQQTPASPQTPSMPVNSLPANVRLPVVLKTTLDTSKCKAGDEIQLEMLANLRDPAGRIAVPRGAKLFGTVTEAIPRAKGHSESHLGFLVHRAEWKGGWISLKAAFDKPLRQAESDIFTRGGSSKVVATPDVAHEIPRQPTDDLDQPPAASPFFGVRVDRSQEIPVLISEVKTIILDRGTRFLLRQLSTKQ